MKPREVFVAYAGAENYLKAWKLWMDLCWKHGVSATCGYSGQSLKSQLREANKLDCQCILILNEDKTVTMNVLENGKNKQDEWDKLQAILEENYGKEKETAQAG